MNREKTKENVRRLPLVAKIFFIMGGLSVILYVLFMLSPAFSDFFNRYISSVLRAALAYATSFIPFSMGEFFIILSPVILISLAVLGSIKFSETWRDVFVFCGTVVSVLALILSLFTIGFAPAYRGTGLDEKLGIDRQDVSAQELYDTAIILSERINEEYKNIYYDMDTKFSVMPYELTDMNDLLIDAYGTVCDKYSFVQRLDSRIKPVMLSELMSYTHITGVYSFFTGEANINVAFPDYTVPFTAAHELAHQRGIAREDEANFVAFLVTSASEDAYIRYSGYLNLFEYVASALYRADQTRYVEIISRLDQRVVGELRAYSAFFDTYRDSIAADLSDVVNDTHLKLHGNKAGAASYGLVVDLAVAYHRQTALN